MSLPENPSVKSWLVLYNFATLYLWLAVLIRLVILYFLVTPKFVAGGLSEFTMWVQTLAALDVVHALLGFVKTSPFTAFVQVYSRFVVVWGIAPLFPEAVANSAFCSMLLAWSLSEIIRSMYYISNIRYDGDVFPWIVWLRYSAFYVLYPIGASSEWILMFLSLPDAELLSPLYALFIKSQLVIWPPSLVYLYSHMMRIRGKAMAKHKLGLPEKPKAD